MTVFALLFEQHSYNQFLNNFHQHNFYQDNRICRGQCWSKVKGDSYHTAVRQMVCFIQWSNIPDK